MKLCSKQKRVKKNQKHVLYFRFLQVAIFCFDYRFVYSELSLDELHNVLTWIGF